jgi:hypothetical protein
MLRIRIRDPVPFDPCIRDGKNLDPGSGMNIPDLISENMESVNSLMQIRIRDLTNPGYGGGKSRIRDEHLGSATLVSL